MGEIFLDPDLTGGRVGLVEGLVCASRGGVNHSGIQNLVYIVTSQGL